MGGSIFPEAEPQNISEVDALERLIFLSTLFLPLLTITYCVKFDLLKMLFAGKKMILVDFLSGLTRLPECSSVIVSNNLSVEKNEYKFR